MGATLAPHLEREGLRQPGPAQGKLDERPLVDVREPRQAEPSQVIEGAITQKRLRLGAQGKRPVDRLGGGGLEEVEAPRLGKGGRPCDLRLHPGRHLPKGNETPGTARARPFGI